MEQTYTQPNISDVLTAKQQRVENLKKKKNEFDDIISHHNATKLKLKVGSFFYHFKKFILTLIIVALLAGSLTVIIYPRMILQSEDFGDFLVSTNTFFYIFSTASGFSRDVRNLKAEYNIHNEEELINAIFYNIIETDLLNKIRIFAVLIIFLALIMAFSVRQTTKLRKVKKRITYLEDYSVNIIKDFTENINAETKELEILGKIVQKD
jgi:uncharacterized membrane protein YfcA